MRNKKYLRVICFVLSAAMLLTSSAFASTMGDYLTGYSVTQGTGMTLAKGIYWTGSDYRNENYIEYTPQQDVQPMVVYGSKLTNYGSFSSMSQLLAKNGYHVIAGINGDYYNMSNYEPLGVVIYEGKIISSDGYKNAIGFNADGTAVIGKPDMKAALSMNGLTENIHINKARQASRTPQERIFSLFTSDYAPTTKSQSAGFDVICTPSTQQLQLDSSVTLTVDEVIEDTGAVSIPNGKMVLSLAATATEERIAAVKSLKPGDTFTVDVSVSENWKNVQFAVGSLYKLVTDGKVENGLDTTLEPRSAVGLKADGTLVLYTVDGRRSGYSVGATMVQVANRLIELGCVEATIMDGGGSTSMNAIYLGDQSISQINKSSGTTQRSVTNYIVLATKNAPTGVPAQLAVSPFSTTMLIGAQRTFSVKAADMFGYSASTPSDITWSVTGDAGIIDSNGVFTGIAEGTCVVTASSPECAEASVQVRVIETPGSIVVKDESTGSTVSSISAKAGSVINLTASSMFNHINLLSSDQCYDWQVTEGIGSIDKNGSLKVADVTGSGTVTVGAGAKSISVPISTFQTGSFDDVLTTSWYYDSVEYVNEKGVIVGTGKRQFSPNLRVSRAMIATVLWNMQNRPEAIAESSFTDVPGDAWYAQSVAWAQENGIISGYSDGTFKPNTEVTREQMAAMLYRYQAMIGNTKKETVDLSSYSDASAISPWAEESFAWCVSNNIICGIGDKLDPKGTATRAQMAAVVQRYLSMF